MFARAKILITDAQSPSCLSLEIAAQLAADARLRAKRTSQAVAHRIEDVRHRAEDVRDRAKDQTRIMREKAAELRERAEHAKDRAVAAKDTLMDMKDKVKQRVSPKTTSRKFFSDARSILPPEGKPLPMVHTRISGT
ncbi:hypothetical protein FGB62_48g076 [Gracilaria domingensis]|nr:hypothetical protein FGB62_48g076 [Gracilaria domingensis]